MAAIVGLVSEPGEAARAHLERVRARLRYYTRPASTIQSIDRALHVLTVREHAKRDLLSHHANDRFVGWLVGYAFQGIDEPVPLAATTALEQMFEAIAADRLPDCVRQLEGVFFAVVYDLSTATVHFATDRLGLRPLYLRADSDMLAWSSEAKGAAPAVLDRAILDHSSVDVYLKLGHLVGDTTFFRGVLLAPPAAVGRWRVGMQQPAWSHYWTWAEVRQVPEITLDDAVSELARLWPRAVKRAVAVGGDHLHLWLSGGFDSRLIAAELARQGTVPPSITVGSRDSTEVMVARAVGRALGFEPTHLVLDDANWFENRPLMAYKTDCAANFLHLHKAPFLREFQKFGDFFIEGFWGGSGLGGGYYHEKFVDRRADAEASQHYYSGLGTGYDQPYLAIPHVDPFLLYTHTRRFTRPNGMAVSDQTENVMPFVDGELPRFLMSLPDGLRKNKQLYAAFATRHYGNVFDSIPHARSGKTISGIDLSGQTVNVNGAEVSIPTGGGVGIMDFEQALRAPQMLPLFSRYLDPKRSVLASLGHPYSKHFEIWQAREFLKTEKPWKHRQYRELSCRALSFELWAEQLGI